MFLDGFQASKMVVQEIVNIHSMFDIVSEILWMVAISCTEGWLKHVEALQGGTPQ